MDFIKASVSYEATVGERKYVLTIPANAPIGEAYDVAYKFLSIISDQAKVISDNSKPKEPVVSEAKE